MITHFFACYHMAEPAPNTYSWCVLFHLPPMARSRARFISPFPLGVSTYTSVRYRSAAICRACSSPRGFVHPSMEGARFPSFPPPTPSGAPGRPPRDGPTHASFFCIFIDVNSPFCPSVPLLCKFSFYFCTLSFTSRHSPRHDGSTQAS